MRDSIRGRTTTIALSVVAAIAVAVGVYGCGGGGSGGSGGGSGSAAKLDVVATTPPATGSTGQVTWDLPFGEPASLDYTQSFSYSENTVLSNLCEGLLRLSPEGQLKPNLATSYKQTGPDTWVYDIRPGVKFWNGEPLTADDVVASLDRQLDPEVASLYSVPFGEEIAGFKKTGPMQVTMTTKVPNLVLNEMMATGLGTVASAKFLKSAGSNFGTPSGGLMCTGPYKLGKWEPGKQITIERNDDYWGEEPKNAGITFKFVEDSDTLTNALLSGEIEGTYEAPASATSQLQSNSDVKLYLGNSTQFLALFPIAGSPAMENLKVRRAISMSLDRNAISDAVFAGAASPLKTAMLMPTNYLWESKTFSKAYDELPEPKLDVAAAKKLVAEANVPSSPIVIGLQAGDTASLQIANAVIDAGKQIGLKMEAKQFPAAQYYQLFFDPKAREAIDIMLANGYSDIPDPLFYFQLTALPGAAQNFTKYDNPTVNKSIEEASAEQDPHRRAELALTALKQWDEDEEIIPLLYLPERLALSSGLTGAPVTFPYQYNQWAPGVGSASK